MKFLSNGGPVLWVIIVVSFYAAYIFFERFLKLRKERIDADSLMVRVNAAIVDRDLDAALYTCENFGGPVSRVIETALIKLPSGRTAVEAAFKEGFLREEQHLSRGLRPLATIAQIAPLLGLLGTVTGMIKAFAVIESSGLGNSAELAGGIGQALITTAAGLIVAIPALIGHNYLASRVDAILLEIERRREELMANVAQVVASKKQA